MCSVEISRFVEYAVLYIILHFKNIFRHAAIILATFVVYNFLKNSLPLQKKKYSKMSEITAFTKNSHFCPLTL